MKAIETRYAGYRFRSRLEARWAVFFDSLELEWEYEKQGYELPSGLYLPDFWLPALEVWVEVKGQEPSRDELRLAEQLSEHHHSAAVFWGLPGEHFATVFCADVTDSTGGSSDWDECVWCYDRTDRRFKLQSGDTRSCRTYHHRALLEPFPGLIGALDPHSFPLTIQHACNLARAARFEHGECG